MIKALFLLFSVAAIPYSAQASPRRSPRPFSEQRKAVDSRDQEKASKDQTNVPGSALNVICWFSGLIAIGCVKNKDDEGA